MLVLLGHTSAALGQVAEERIGLDPVLHGVWVAHAMSTDRGRTVEPVQPPQPFAVASAGRIRFEGGNAVRVTKVMITEDDQGFPSNVALLDNGKLLAITKEPGQPYVMIQTFEGEREMFRVLVTVD